MDNAAHFYRQHLAGQGEGAAAQGGQEALDALLFLASHHRDKHEYQQSADYCSKLLDGPDGSEKDEARALLRSRS